MKSSCLVSGIVLLLSISSALAQESGGDVAKQLKGDPNSAAALKAFMSAKLGEVQSLSRTDPDAALKVVSEMLAVLEGVAPDQKEAQERLQQAQGYLKYAQEQLTLMKTPIDELVKQLEQNPADAKVILHYVEKVMQAAAGLVGSDPGKAAESIKEAKMRLETLRGKTRDSQEVTATIERAEQSLLRVEQFIQDQIEREQRLAAMVGKDAAPLKADAWVNGKPLTDEEVKGKVVLLDFWAVWCGPCIQTFPHLRQWHETYKDQGLVIIGVTNYTKAFAWDPAKNDVLQSQSEVSPEAEQAMLGEFAKKHELKQVFAVQNDSVLAEYYAVESIPEVVLIDRVGKVRMIKVGTGPNTAQEIEEMLKQLLDEGGAGGSSGQGG